MRPGQRLPSERELAKRFGTSRTALRSAMKVLEGIGVITQRIGDGSYLNSDASLILTLPLNFLVLLDDISLIDLFEARLMIEPELAARAAESASTEELDAMRRSFAAMATDTVNADIAFHDAVHKATRNATCHRMFGAIHRVFRQGMILNTRLVTPEHTLAFHKAIYSAIHLRQPDEARRQMRAHLIDSKTLLLRASLERDHSLTSDPVHWEDMAVPLSSNRSLTE